MTNEDFKLYFEDGFYITKQEQEAHDLLVKQAQKETARFIKTLVISMSKKFATIERKRLG